MAGGEVDAGGVGAGEGVGGEVDALAAADVEDVEAGGACVVERVRHPGGVLPA